MSKEEAKKSIAALHLEIDKLDTPDSAVKEKLLALINDVEKQLQAPDLETGRAGQITDQPSKTLAEAASLREANLQTLPFLIEQFESDHPKVTDTLGQLLNTLSGMGI